MKRIFSLMLVALLLVSTIPTAFALGLTRCDVCTDGAYYLTTCTYCSAESAYCPRCDTCVSCGHGQIPEVGTTTVTVVGAATKTYYEVEVPSTMAPGDSTDVTVTGTWKSTETLKVSAPDKVTLYNGDQSIDVAIDFEDIMQVGSDKTVSSATATLTLEDVTVQFGTWTGTIEYTVEVVEAA